MHKLVSSAPPSLPVSSLLSFSSPSLFFHLLCPCLRLLCDLSALRKNGKSIKALAVFANISHSGQKNCEYIGYLMLIKCKTSDVFPKMFVFHWKIHRSISIIIPALNNKLGETDYWFCLSASFQWNRLPVVCNTGLSYSCSWSALCLSPGMPGSLILTSGHDKNDVLVIHKARLQFETPLLVPSAKWSPLFGEALMVYIRFNLVQPIQPTFSHITRSV